MCFSQAQQYICSSTGKKLSCKIKPIIYDVSQPLANTVRYGPYTLAVSTLLGLVAFSSASTTLPELVPWLPLSISVYFLLTVFSAPRVHEFFTPTEDFDILMEEGQCRTSARTPVEPGSIQSDEDIQSHQETFENTLRLQNHNLSFMGPASQFSGGSSHSNSIILSGSPRNPDVFAAVHTVGLAQEDAFFGMSPQTWPQSGKYNPLAMDTEARNIHMPRSMSPDSMDLNHNSSSFRREEERPLL